MNRCNILFAISRVEDCLELNFKYADYQALAHLSYSFCVCLISLHATRVQRFISVRVLINASILMFSCVASEKMEIIDCLVPKLWSELHHGRRMQFFKRTQCFYVTTVNLNLSIYYIVLRKIDMSLKKGSSKFSKDSWERQWL